jgi:hypothetical protein
MAAMASYARKHVKYHSSTRMDGRRGILHLDKPVEFHSVTDPTTVMGTITLLEGFQIQLKNQLNPR